MAAPIAALPFVGKAIAGAGIWTGAKRALPKVGSRLQSATTRIGGILGRNKTGAAAAGAGGGFGVARITDKLGIEDARADLLVYGGLVVGAVVAFGQLFDIELGG